MRCPSPPTAIGGTRRTHLSHRTQPEGLEEDTMSTTWQDIVAILLITVAAIYVIRRIWYSITGRRKPGCADCSACSRPPTDQDLISIDPPKKD